MAYKVPAGIYEDPFGSKHVWNGNSWEFIDGETWFEHKRAYTNSEGEVFTWNGKAWEEPVVPEETVVEPELKSSTDSDGAKAVLPKLPSNPPTSTKAKNKTGALLIVLLVVFFFVFMLINAGLQGISGPSTGSGSSGQTSVETQVEPEVEAPPPVPNVPDGFKDWGNGIGTMSIEGTCDSGTRCVWYQVYAYWDCPSGVYIEGNILDGNGTIIDMSNELIGSMAAGNSATVNLKSFYSNAEQMQLTKVNCY